MKERERERANSEAISFYLHRYFFDKEEKERNLFLYLQEDLEKHTNKLSGLYEKDINELENYNSFYAWKEEVTSYTSITKKVCWRAYF